MTSVLINPTLTPTLVLDDTLDLLGPNTYGGTGFLLTAQGDDATWGNPVPIDVWVESQLQDGAVVYTQGYDNRDMFLRVKVRADDATGLQAGEAALVAACGKRTTLAWTPPDGFAATSVFKVHTIHLEHVFDGDEERARTRTYGLRITAAPFVRSVDRITLLAEPAGVAYAETVIDEITSVTAWTASGTKTAEGSGQAVRSTDSHVPIDDFDVWLERSGSVTISGSTPYIRVKGAASWPDAIYTLTVDGTTDYAPVVTIGNLRWFEVPAGTYSTIRVTAHHTAVTPQPGRPVSTWMLTLWSLYQTNSAGLGTRREVAKTFPNIVGTVRAPGDLVISHAISGGREPLNGTPTWTVPANALPVGGYHFLARIRHTSAAGTYAVTYTAEVGGTTITRTVNITLDATNTWQTVALGTEHLPPLRLADNSTSDVTITLTTAVANLQLDTAWLFLADEPDRRTALIRAKAGAAKELTYRIADVGSPVDIVYLDDYAAGTLLQAADTPHLVPPAAKVYAVTSGTEDAEVRYDYHPHWYTHPGQ